MLRPYNNKIINEDAALQEIANCDLGLIMKNLKNLLVTTGGIIDYRKILVISGAK